MTDVGTNLIFIDKEFVILGWVVLVIFISVVISLSTLFFYNNTNKNSEFVSLIAGLISLVSLIVIFVLAFAYSEETIDKNAAIIKSWLYQEHSIDINKNKVAELIKDNGFENFVISEPDDKTRVSETFTYNGEEYLLIWKDKKLNVQKIDF